MLKRYVKTSVDFFPAGLAIPFWVCGLTFISAERRKRAIRQTLKYRK
jgi:hypothetical protein